MPGTPVDLTSFRPGSADELLDGIVSHLAPLIGAHWLGARREIGAHLRQIADKAQATRDRLLAGEISADDAAFLFEMQALNFANVVRLAQFSTFVVAQAVVDTVFAVVTAAVANVTGLPIARPGAGAG